MDKKEFKKVIKEKTKEELKSMIEGHPTCYFIIVEGKPHRIDYWAAHDRIWFDSKEVKK